MSLDNTTVTKRYARALFEVALEKGRIDEIQTELKDVKKIFDENQGLSVILTDKGITIDQKLDLIKPILNQASDLVKNLIQMTFDYGRINLLTDIISEFDNLYDANNKVVRATAITAIALDDKQMAELSQNFAHKLNVNKVVLHNKIDDSIIGGVILKTNGLVYDGSIKTQINQIKQSLLG